MKKLDCIDCSFTAQLTSRFLAKAALSRRRKSITLSEYVDEEFLRLEETALKNHGPDVNVDFQFYGTPVAKQALFETLLKYKKSKLELNEEETAYYNATLSNCIRSVLAARRIFDRDNTFECVVSHSPEYGPNNSFVDQALKYGVRTYSIRGSNNLAEMNSSVLISDWNYLPRESVPLRTWPGKRNFQERYDDNERVEAHLTQLRLANSPFVYSAKTSNSLVVDDLFEALRLSRAKPVYLVSLSSSDEATAGSMIGRTLPTQDRATVYRDQFEWVSDTIDFFSSRPNVQLVIRLHPRDLPNKRDGRVSEQYPALVQLLAELPSNVVVNHPDQQIAFSDLCTIISGLITGWSSTAIEAMLQGIPVVTYDSNLPGFPEDIHETGNSKSEYVTNLSRLVAGLDGGQAESDARKWLMHYLNHGSARLTGRLFEKLRLMGPRFFDRILNGMDRFLFFVWRPFELRRTFRTSADREKIIRLFSERRTDLY
jgi:hypothetical protein